MQTSGFPPETLRQYALLADGERGALIGPRGDIAFLCAPHWHSPAVFSSLIGGNGHYAVTPCGRYVWGGYYEPGTLIWHSRWVTEYGIVESHEALAMPADPDRVVILRHLQCIEGSARVRTVLDPRADFGSHGHDLRRVEGAAPAIWEGTTGPLRLRWLGGPESRPSSSGAVEGTLDLRAGQSHELVLEIASSGSQGLPAEPVRADDAWRSTRDAWCRRKSSLAPNIAPGEVSHSYAVLRGLTSRSNGMVAAATMSLPERADTGRNYDYRYAWIRDQCYAGEAAALAGAEDLLVSATDFVATRLLADGPGLKPAYTVSGGRVPDESSVPLPGYPGAGVKVGNWVNEQFQLDAFGEALLLLSCAAEQGLLSPEQHRAALVAGRAVASRWREPDAGIWELENRVWTHSRLICAAGLRRYARAVPGARTNDWDSLADRIVAETSRTCLHHTGRWQRAPDIDGVGSALLLPALRGAVPAEDPRSVATYRAVARELSDDGYVFRYRHRPGALNDAEGAFLLSGFHMAMSSHQLGHHAQAVRWFERNRGAVGPPGLFTEEYDVVQRQLRGNVPQAFVHAALMESATRLVGSGDLVRKGDWGPSHPSTARLDVFGQAGSSASGTIHPGQAGD